MLKASKFSVLVRVKMRRLTAKVKDGEPPLIAISQVRDLCGTVALHSCDISKRLRVGG